MSAYVYILTNSANTVLYIGVINNIARRMHEHKNGLIEGFSKRYKLHKLVYCETCSSITEAIHREKQLKPWRRAWKEDLINSVNPQWKDLEIM